MNAKELFKKARERVSDIPLIVRTPFLTVTIMRAEVSSFISNQEYDAMSGYDGDRAKAILKTANEALAMIDEYIREEII